VNTSRAQDKENRIQYIPRPFFSGSCFKQLSSRFANWTYFIHNPMARCHVALIVSNNHWNFPNIMASITVHTITLPAWISETPSFPGT